MVQLPLQIFFQVVVESLPVSSSGHIFLLFSFLNFFYNTQKGLCVNESVEFLLHIPTLIIVGTFFFAPWWRILKDFLCLKKDALLLAAWCILADGITIFWYFLFSKIGKNWFPLPLGFFVTGLLLYSLKHNKKNEKQNVSFLNGMLLGMVQGFALLPGISRFGSTFVAARWLGFSRSQAFEYSFLIQFPLLFAAIIKGFYFVDGTFLRLNLLTIPILFVFVISGTISYFALLWVKKVVDFGFIWCFCFYLVPLSFFVFLFL